MANIAPNITSVGISCEPPPPAPPGEGAIAHATSGKKGFIGPSGYPIVREKPSPEGVERAADDRLAHRRHEAEVKAHVVQREQPVREQLLRHEEMAEKLLAYRSEEHTSELQSRPHLVCRLLLDKKKHLVVRQ